MTASERRKAIMRDLSVRRFEKISNLAFRYHVMTERSTMKTVSNKDLKKLSRISATEGVGNTSAFGKDHLKRNDCTFMGCFTFPTEQCRENYKKSTILAL